MRYLSIIKYTVLFLLMFALELPVSAESGVANKLTFSPTNLPKFKDYPARETYKGKVAPVDLNSDSEAHQYRTRLREGVKNGPNFAGHYVAITIGCGSNCQMQWIVNAKNGKVIDKFMSSLGAGFHLNSNLLILNPPTDELAEKYKEMPNASFLSTETAYYILEKNTLTLIYKESLPNILKNYSKGQ